MSIQLFFLDKLMRLTAKRRFRRNPDVRELRPLMAEMAAAREGSAAGLAGRDFARRRANRSAAPRGRKRRQPPILYIHGGGWVAGAPVNHRGLTWRLAAQTGATVYAIDYRLAPEHPFPAGLDDCVAAYRALLDNGIARLHRHRRGFRRRKFDAGNGAQVEGAGAATARALVCLSPVVALDAELPSHRTNAKSGRDVRVRHLRHRAAGLFRGPTTPPTR